MRNSITIILVSFISVYLSITVQADEDNNLDELYYFDSLNQLSNNINPISQLSFELNQPDRKKPESIPVTKKQLKNVLIERLIDPISQAIHNYYGEDKLWYRGLEKILQIAEDESDNAFLLTVQVQTFEGAHNPPYGEETITFKINGSDIKVVEYKHRDIPKEEWLKSGLN
nr:DUF3888 domain-containing protein [Ornithinibacillus contaminans]